MNASKTIVRLLAMASATFGLAASAFGQATFRGLGDLPGGIFQSFAFATSADGSVVVGEANSASGNEAFRWTSAAGMVGLDDLSGGIFQSAALATSADGSVVVGVARSASGAEAFRWTSGGGMVGLGDLPGGIFQSFASATSADGAVVVGQGQSASGTGEAFRWTSAGGMVGLGFLSGGANSVADATSADGAVVVGNGRSTASEPHFEAFRWTSGGGMVGLGDLPGSILRSRAIATSADGAVVVGFGNSASGGEAFRWTSCGGMVGLGDIPGGNFVSVAFSVSADGAVVVGRGFTAAGPEAFLWTADNGMRKLQDLLVADFGLDLTGWQLLQAEGISADGPTIVGWGTNPEGFIEAWIATIFNDCNANGIPDVTEADTDLDDVPDDCDQCPGFDDKIDTDADGTPDCVDLDDDCDGILDEVDAAPIVVSTIFSDLVAGGTTFGELVNVPAGVSVEVRDATAGGKGVQISTLGTEPIEIRLCNDVSSIFLNPKGGKAKAIYTCGSLIVEVIEGASTVVFTIDGVDHEVVVDEGGTVTLEETLDESGELETITVTVAADSDQGSVSVDGQDAVPGQTLDVLGVEIDIKPGSSPNTINLGSNGTVPVAIFSTLDFDATSIDPLTIALAGAAVQLRGRGTPQFWFHDVNNDGLTDLLVHVDTEALKLSETDTEAVLTASADADGDGISDTIIRGLDTIRVVP